MSASEREGEPPREPARQTPKQAGRRPWYQYRIGWLFGVVAVVSVTLALYTAPYHAQRRTMSLVEELGGTCLSRPAANWLGRLNGDWFRDVVLVDLADCDEPKKYLDRIVALPCLETLVVGGEAFGDEHLQPLYALRSLERLVLDTTSVSDERLAALQRALPVVKVSRIQRRAMKEFERLGGRVLRRSFSAYHYTDQELRSLFGEEYVAYAEAVRIEGDASAALLWRFPGVADVRCTDGVSDAALAHFHHLKLRRIFLRGTQVSDAGLAHLQGLNELAWLDLSGTRVTDAALAHLVELPQLRLLELADTAITDAGVAQLKNLPQLESLDLSGTRITDAGLVHFQQFDKHRWLTLNLSKTQVTDAGLVHLKNMPTLGSLALFDTRMTGDGLAALADIPNLSVLHLGSPAITDADLARLTALKQLGGLVLHGSQFTDAALVQVKEIPTLHSLDVMGARLSDEGLLALRSMNNLRSLILRHVPITDAGLRNLAGIATLRRIIVVKTRVTKDGVENLKKALPGCEVLDP